MTRITNCCALQIQGKSVLELGAGFGLAGIVAACVLGAERVILTDLHTDGAYDDECGEK